MSSPSSQSQEARALVLQASQNWGLLLAAGIASIVIGGLILSWPTVTLEIVAVIFIIWLIVSGVVRIVQAFAMANVSGGLRFFIGLTGVLSLVLAWLAFSFSREGQTLTEEYNLDIPGGLIGPIWLLALFVGFSWVFTGIGQMAAGFAKKGESGAGWDIALGILGIIAGFIIIFVPQTIEILVWVAGIMLIVLGLFELVSAFQLRSAGKAALSK